MSKKNEVKGVVGAEEIIKKATDAITNDGFLLIAITGDRGFGKSTLSFHLLREILQTYTGQEIPFDSKLLNHVIFTIDDFFNVDCRDIIKSGDRAACLLWDDFALHTSSYMFSTAERNKISYFVELFEVVRENCACLIVNAATFDLVPPKIRNAPHFIIDCIKRGEALLYKKKRILWLEVRWKSINKIKFGSIPSDFYNEYRKLKHKAIKVKKMMYMLKLEEKAKKLAENLTMEELRNEELLMAYGLVDLQGNKTLLGKLVEKHISTKYPKNMSVREFLRLVRTLGIKGSNEKLIELYHAIYDQSIRRS